MERLYNLRKASLHHVIIKLKTGLPRKGIIMPVFFTIENGERISHPNESDFVIGIMPKAAWGQIREAFNTNEPLLAAVPEGYTEISVDDISGFEICE